MPDDRSSYELLAHFDRPKVVGLNDFEWDEEAESFERGVIVNEGRLNDWGLRSPGRPGPQPPTSVQRVRVRGAGWVLMWAGAFAVISVAIGVLSEFALLIAAQHSLDAAARAAAVEATLPRATYRTIAETIERRLNAYPQLYAELQLDVMQNDAPVGNRLRIAAGDRIAISLSAPTWSVLPNWLVRVPFWRSKTPISARAEKGVPGRKLRMSAS